MLYTSVLHGLQISPHFAARLAASGALDWIVADLTGSQSAVLGLEQAHRDDVMMGLALLAKAAHQTLQSAGSEQARAISNIAQHQPALAAALDRLTKSGPAEQLLSPGSAVSQMLLHTVLPAARQLGAALLEWWALPEQAGPLRLEAAQAAAARSCAYLRCANLAAEGGPAAGQGVGSMRCSACRVVWYCGAACSHADWREGGHRRMSFVPQLKRLVGQICSFTIDNVHAATDMGNQAESICVFGLERVQSSGGRAATELASGLAWRLPGLQPAVQQRRLFNLLDASLTADEWLLRAEPRDSLKLLRPLAAAQCEALLALQPATLEASGPQASTCIFEATAYAPEAYTVLPERTLFDLMSRLLHSATQPQRAFWSRWLQA
ncbi:HIT MYND zinc finger [Chlorella sorokiniana]|uniref:HIT MYND zinc finger n=1 Tax=Chlorella sorokiniana TaxID=3076 RepID=A0A2P6TZK4_CHLSO|nr:HIT MYND zinc finger [Chlorella sorokiniana]|eukprot:PRW59495.1 HIT MYND zinc finger [Chlorella sorokiniana]